MQLPWKSLLAAVGVLTLLVVLIWFFFLRTPSSVEPVPTPTTSGFTTGTVVTTEATLPQEADPSDAPYGYTGTQRIFKIADGPVVAATFVQTFNPTTTVARYVMQDNGRVFDLPIDVPGSVPRAVSNTTIPAIAHALWGEGGESVVLQYMEEVTVKTLYMRFSPRATSTIATPLPPQIRFLPDNIFTLAISPDGKKLAYMLVTTGGATGYVANINGTESKTLFFTPLTQVRLTWPAANTLLMQTKAAVGVSGMAFSIALQSGTVTPLLHAAGLSIIADPAFEKVIYQTSTLSDVKTYSHDVVSGKDLRLSFDPFPEKCVQSGKTSSLIYCALPLAYISPQYLDLWYKGLASAADSLVAFNPTTGARIIIGTPGQGEGGKKSDIVGIAVAPADAYLSFVTKGDRSLWGVRLTQ